jgi:hypothetical protein
METWIETIALFQEPNEDLEKLGIEQCTEDIPTPFIFKLSDLTAFNEDSTKKMSTIWLRGDCRVTITMSIDELILAIRRSPSPCKIYNHINQSINVKNQD